MAAIDTRGQRHDRVFSRPGQGDGDQCASPDLVPHTDGEVTLGQRMLSAVSGSVLTSLLVTPLDVVRVRQQAQQGPSPSTISTRLPSFLHLPPQLGITSCCREVFWVPNQSQFCVANTSSLSAPVSAVMDERSVVSDCAVEETRRRTFTSTLDGLRKIARNEGVWTLWRGLSPTLMMAIPANVIYFAGYDWLRTSTRSPLAGRVGDNYAPLAAGSIARVLAAVAVSPIEMLRTRMQATSAERGVLRATVAGLQDMVMNEGFQSLWKGLTLTLWRDVPFSALYWWGYEYGRERLHELRSQPAGPHGRERRLELSHAALLVDSFVAGSVSGALSAFVTTPFDVGKTRQQTALHDGSKRGKDIPEHRSMPRFLGHIYRTEGMAGLFKGWAARCLKVAPACAIMISSYEIGKKMAGSANEHREAV